MNADEALAVIPAQVELSDVGPLAKPEAMPVPEPVKAEQFSFEHESEPTFIVPDIIVHSTRVNQYVAINSKTERPHWQASNSSKKMSWHPINSVTAFQPNLTFYLAGQAVDLSLIADRTKIGRPDLIVECKSQNEWYLGKDMEEIAQQYASLQPRSGTYVITKDPVPEIHRDDGIYILTAGFDQRKLRPIISTMTNYWS